MDKHDNLVSGGVASCSAKHGSSPGELPLRLFELPMGGRGKAGLALLWARSAEEALERFPKLLQKGELVAFSVTIESNKRVGFARVWASSLEEVEEAIQRRLRPGYQIKRIWRES